jgi:uncharacterized protein (TIGR03437 family)
MQVVLIVWALLAVTSLAQEQLVILQVDVENVVNYLGDVADPTRVARSPLPVTPNLTPFGNFYRNMVLGDVTAINGSLTRGLFVREVTVLRVNPAPTPTQAIGDVNRLSSGQILYEFVKPDGISFGTLFAMDLQGVDPGAIVGGSGAFLGARGSVTITGSPRFTSQAEDPSMRRINGGGRQRHVLQIFPMFRPEVVAGANGPALFHNDFSLVTAANPARAGETLIVYTKGLGPTNPAVNPGEAFPNGPFAVVASPVEVLVNGKSSEAINQLGVPGSTDTYRVDFRVPDDTQAGTAQVQIGAAWVKGAAVSIPTR